MMTPSSASGRDGEIPKSVNGACSGVISPHTEILEIPIKNRNRPIAATIVPRTSIFRFFVERSTSGIAVEPMRIRKK